MCTGKGVNSSEERRPSPSTEGTSWGWWYWFFDGCSGGSKECRPLPPPKVFIGWGGIFSLTVALASLPLPIGRTFSSFRSSEIKLLTAIYFCVTGYIIYCNFLRQSITVCRPDLYKKSFNLHHGTPLMQRHSIPERICSPLRSTPEPRQWGQRSMGLSMHVSLIRVCVDASVICRSAVAIAYCVLAGTEWLQHCRRRSIYPADGHMYFSICCLQKGPIRFHP